MIYRIKDTFHSFNKENYVYSNDQKFGEIESEQLNNFHTWLKQHGKTFEDCEQLNS